MGRTCGTCAKRKDEKTCHVLTKMIGKTRPCFAWSDDPEWEQKVKAAVRAYRLGLLKDGKWPGYED